MNTTLESNGDGLPAMPDWRFKKPICRDFEMPKGEMFCPPAKYDGLQLIAFKPKKVVRAAGFSADGRTYDKPKKGHKRGVRRCVVRLKGRDCPTSFLIGTYTKQVHRIRPPVLGGAWRPQGLVQSQLGTRKYKAPNYNWAARQPTTGKGRVIGTIQKGTRSKGIKPPPLAKYDADFWAKVEK